MKPPILKSLKLKEIEIADLQARAATDDKTIEEYAEAYRNGEKFPPAVVFHDGKSYFLADGFHRYFGAQKAGFNDLLCDVREGTRKDALWFAVGANRTHGLKRTNADKRNAVEMALREKPELPDAAIANHVGVSWDLVKSVRIKTSEKEPELNPPKRVLTDGRVFSSPLPPVPQVSTPVPELPRGKEPVKEPKKESPKLPPAPVVIPDSVRDRYGHAIPRAVLPLWERAEEASTMLLTISTLRGMLRKAQEEKDMAFVEVNFSAAQSELDQAYTDLKVIKPHCVCPACKGASPGQCTLCFKKGFVSEFRWKTVAEESRELWIKTGKQKS